MNYWVKCKDCYETNEIKQVDWRIETCPSCGSIELEALENWDEEIENEFKAVPV
jgi:Zn finger protein HypA/HybF involved in hydrogenase expression